MLCLVVCTQCEHYCDLSMTETLFVSFCSIRGVWSILNSD